MVRSTTKKDIKIVKIQWSNNNNMRQLWRPKSLYVRNTKTYLTRLVNKLRDHSFLGVRNAINFFKCFFTIILTLLYILHAFT